MVVSGEGRSLSDDGPTRPMQILGHILRQQRHAAAGGEQDLPVIWRDLTAQHSQERGLAGAVAPEQTDPFPGLDLTGDAVQQRRPAKGDVEVAEGDKRHEAYDWSPPLRAHA